MCCKAPTKVDLMEIFPLTAVSKSKVIFLSIVTHLIFSCTSLQYLLCGDFHYKFKICLLCGKKNATNRTFKKNLMSIIQKRWHCWMFCNHEYCPSWNTNYRSDARVTDDHLLTGIEISVEFHVMCLQKKKTNEKLIFKVAQVFFIWCTK